MSNTHAIAAVTSTVRYVLQRALEEEPDPVPGHKVTTLRPAQVADLGSDDNPARGLNVFLYQVTPNHAWNLTDLPTRHGDGSLARRPLAALDLHYLVTAYGDDAALEPQRMIARAGLALATTPVLTKDVVEDAIAVFGAQTPTAFLDRADLAGQPEAVKLSPTPLSLEEMARLWGVLGTPYLLSQAFTATVVLLEAAVPVRRSLPVATPVVDVRTYAAVEVTGVEVVGGGAAATGATVVLTGAGLASAHTVVVVARQRLRPDPGSTSAHLTVTLPPEVPAGVHALRVCHLRPADASSGAPERVLARSDAVPLLVVPTVGTVTTTAAQVRVAVVPPLVEGQRATVTFGRLVDAGDDPDVPPPLVAATFAPVAGPDAPLARLDVPRERLTPGTWLVRVSVDGADSLPTLGGSGTYDAPVVTIT
ncbi:DUF4255 domain-containing protein [Isoptericola jiangsuensis]|uniref:DUF4255 domain-containing protein n=1 Tax=Isoptericola jiangsuensis TaxID=548579 RepID=UPI003AAABF45